MEPSTSRTLGYTGALLIAIGSIAQILSLGQYYAPLSAVTIFGSILGVLAFVGIILFLVAMWGYSKAYSDSGIFNNALFGFISSIVGAIVVAVVTIVIMLSNLREIIGSYTPSFPFTSGSVTELMESLIGYLAPVLIASAIISLVQALLYQRAFNKLSEKAEVRLFRTAGILLVISAGVSIIVASVAYVLVLAATASLLEVYAIAAIAAPVALAAWAVAAKAFLGTKPPVKQGPPPPPPGF
jgi:uncharacterized membrane protein